MLALWTVYQLIELHVVTFRLGGRLDPFGGGRPGAATSQIPF